jgi:hypothetical protein
MITKKDLKDYQFENIYQYFDYVLESEVNGQKKQVRYLIGKMSQRQRNQFAVWLENECPFHHSFIDRVKEVLFQTT